MKRKAFTLIELIVVVVIIGVLATVACSQFSAANEKSKVRQTQVHLAALLKAVEGFGYERGDLPTAAQFNADNLTNFGATPAMFICPKDRKQFVYSPVVAGKSWLDWYVQEDASGEFQNAKTTTIIATDGAPFKERGVAYGLGIYRNGTIAKI